VYVAGNTDTDWYVTKFTDNGASATQGWAYTGGGVASDQCIGLAASGPNLYLTGYITNNKTNASGVVFSGAGPPYGITANGASTTTSSDLALVKYVDQGTTATAQWAQVVGGSQSDIGWGVAVSGSSVYVTGAITNDRANTCGVVLAGTVPQLGASIFTSEDWLLAKYTDNGTSASLNWAQVAGGDRSDTGRGVAVSGSSVYVTGAMFGGTSSVYPLLFGGTGTTVGTQPLLGYGIDNLDFVLAKYTDNGSSATVQWAQIGGGPQVDTGIGLAVSGQSIYAVGSVLTPASFDVLPVANSTNSNVNVLARLIDRSLTPLAAAAAGATARAALYPNPARGQVTFGGGTPGATVQVVEALGRPVLASTADASGTARLLLPAGLPAGVYVVRSGSQAARLTVE
jgi:hypothetical protein